MDAPDVMKDRAGPCVGLVRLGRYEEARGLLREAVGSDPEVLRPDAHATYALALDRPSSASIDEARTVLGRVRIKRPAHPEVEAMLGAVAERRMKLRDDAADRMGDPRLAMSCYRAEFERDLNAYYAGSTLLQFDFVGLIGFPEDVLTQAADALRAGAGV